MQTGERLHGFLTFFQKMKKIFDIPPGGRYMVKTNLARKGG